MLLLLLLLLLRRRHDLIATTAAAAAAAARAASSAAASASTTRGVASLDAGSANHVSFISFNFMPQPYTSREAIRALGATPYVMWRETFQKQTRGRGFESRGRFKSF